MTAAPGDQGTRILRGYIGEMVHELNQNRELLLYDGDCAFCQAVVRFVRQRDSRRTLCLAARRSELGAAVLARHPALANVDSVVWLEPTHGGRPEQAHVRSEAVLRVAAYLGGWWRVAAIARLVPRAWRDAMYDAVASRRGAMPGR